MPLQRGEGPVGLIMCPSRELARQTFDIVLEYTDALKAGGRAGQGREVEGAGHGRVGLLGLEALRRKH